MATQLTFDFNSKPAPPDKTPLKPQGWLDVTDIARGVGFTDTILVSHGLHDSLSLRQSELHDDYDQRLYDLLWLAHFKLSLDQNQSARFAFALTCKAGKMQPSSEATLQVRMEVKDRIAFLELLKEF